MLAILARSTETMSRSETERLIATPSFHDSSSDMRVEKLVHELGETSEKTRNKNLHVVCHTHCVVPQSQMDLVECNLEKALLYTRHIRAYTKMVLD